MDVNNQISQITLNMELKSLQDWDAKTGDVFETARGTRFTVHHVNQEDATGRTEYKKGPCVDVDLWYIANPIWHLISRATPTVDLTTITTPFGLLDDDTQKALQECDGGVEIWVGGSWLLVNEPLFSSSYTYRTKPTPPVKTFTQRVWLDDLQCYGTVTGQVQDGKLVGDAKGVVEGA